MPSPVATCHAQPGPREQGGRTRSPPPPREPDLSHRAGGRTDGQADGPSPAPRHLGERAWVWPRRREARERQLSPNHSQGPGGSEQQEEGPNKREREKGPKGAPSPKSPQTSPVDPSLQRSGVKARTRICSQARQSRRTSAEGSGREEKSHHEGRGAGSCLQTKRRDAGQRVGGLLGAFRAPGSGRRARPSRRQARGLRGAGWATSAGPPPCTEARARPRGQ